MVGSRNKPVGTAASAANSQVKRRDKKPLRQLSDAQALEIVEYVLSNLDCKLKLFELAGLVRLRPRQFVRIFSNTFGMTPHQYLIDQRVARAKDLLAGEDMLVEIAAALGFANQSHFSYTFAKITGISPGNFRRDGRRQGPNTQAIVRTKVAITQLSSIPNSL